MGLIFQGVGAGVEVRGGEEVMGGECQHWQRQQHSLRLRGVPLTPATCGQWGMVRGAGAVVLLRVQIQQWPWEWKEVGMLESSGGSVIARPGQTLEWVGSKRERVGGGLGFDLGASVEDGPCQS